MRVPDLHTAVPFPPGAGSPAFVVRPVRHLRRRGRERGPVIRARDLAEGRPVHSHD